MTQEEAIAWVKGRGYKPNPRSKNLWIKNFEGQKTGRPMEARIRITRVRISKQIRYAKTGDHWKSCFSHYLCRVCVNPETQKLTRLPAKPTALHE